MIGSDPTHSSSWTGKTAGEIRDVGEEDSSILVVPVGSVEQHGDHLPVGTDTLLAEAVATHGAELASDLPVVVSPPVWTGYSPHHRHFGGTLTLSFETALAVVEDVVRSGLENGFDAALLINGHGGNGPLIGAAVSEVGSANPDVELSGITYFDLAASFADEIRESDPGGIAHGGEFETSLLLHLYPELVRADGDATPLEEPYDHGDDDLLEPGALSTYRSFEEYSATGAIGEPELASTEKGQAIFERLGTELEDLLWEIHDRNRE